jgi:hypothetical protein
VITIGVAVCCFGIYKLIGWLASDNEPLKAAANIQLDTVNTMTQGNILQGETIQSTQDFVKIFRDLCTRALTDIPGLLMTHEQRIEQITAGNSNLTITCGLLSKMITEIRKHMDIQQQEIAKLFELIESFKHD